MRHAGERAGAHAECYYDEVAATDVRSATIYRTSVRQGKASGGMQHRGAVLTLYYHTCTYYSYM